MSDNWMPILRHEVDGPASIMVCLRFRDEKLIPDASRPSATRIRVPFIDPDHHGMGVAKESSEIDRILDGLEPRLASEASAEVVARVRGGGSARIWVYSDRGARDLIERIAREAFSGRDIDLEHRSDPSWDVYSSMLPAPREERVILDYQLVEVIKGHGDPLTPKRDVRHFIYFFTQSSAEQFSARVRAEGFTVECKEIEPSSDGRSWSVLAARDDSVEHPQISEITGGLVDLATEFSGEYDGWEAMLVKKKGLLSRLFKK